MKIKIIICSFILAFIGIFIYSTQVKANINKMGDTYVTIGSNSYYPAANPNAYYDLTDTTFGGTISFAGDYIGISGNGIGKSYSEVGKSSITLPTGTYEINLTDADLTEELGEAERSMSIKISVTSSTSELLELYITEEYRDQTAPSIKCNGLEDVTLTTTVTYYKYFCRELVFEDNDELASFTISGDSSYEMEISGTSYTFSNTYPYLRDDGSYTITVVDASGNVATGYLIVDTIAPVISCGNSTIYDTDRVYFNNCVLSFSDNIGFDYYSIYEYKNTSGTLKYITRGSENTYTLNSEGVYTVNAWDLAGNNTVANITMDFTSPSWTVSSRDYPISGEKINVNLNDPNVSSYYTVNDTLCGNCNTSLYQYGWSTSSSSFNGTLLDDYYTLGNTLYLEVYAPIVTDDTGTLYYLWIFNMGSDMAGNVSTISKYSNTPYSYGTSENSNLIFRFKIKPPIFNSLFSSATLSEGIITYTFNSSNPLKTNYENGTVTYFMGQRGHTELETAFASYGVKKSFDEFFSELRQSPQGLSGDVCLYIKIESDNLPSYTLISEAITINSTDTLTINFNLENTPDEQMMSEPILLTSSNIVVKENMFKPNYLLFVSMIVISALLAVEVIIIKKHQKAHN